MPPTSVLYSTGEVTNMGRNWETLSSKCTGVLLPIFRENLAEMSHSSKQKYQVLVAVLIFL